MTTTNDIYQTVTDRIIAALENGTAPWLKPWAEGKCGTAGPFNAVTGRPYNGINWLVLGSGGWLTFKQAKELGGSVRKGEKGTQIVFWSFPKIKDSETGEEREIFVDASVAAQFREALARHRESWDAACRQTGQASAPLPPPKSESRL